MSLALAPYREDDLAALRSLVRDPSLAYEFDALVEPDYLDHKLADSLRDRDATLLAREGGEPVGFCITFLLPRAEGGVWAALRIGVPERLRRRGIGSALLAAARRNLLARSIAGGVAEITMSASRPNEAVGAFAARHGFRAVRRFWKMERPVAPLPTPVWPEGVTLRIFDGSEQGFADWHAVYNSSFAQHYHFVPATIERLRKISAAPLWLAGGLALAYRGGRCVGFCANERLGKEAEIGVLGVVSEARGIGLGRALLRWGVCWFGERGEERVTLRVDGENDAATALYRSEGFTVQRTRDLWAIVPGEAGSAALSAPESRSAAGTTPPPAGRP